MSNKTNTSENNNVSANNSENNEKLCFETHDKDSFYNPAFFNSFFENLEDCPEFCVDVLDQAIYCTAQYSALLSSKGGDVNIPVDASDTLFFLYSMKRAFEKGIDNLKFEKSKRDKAA
jgi:hypothetical protein